MADIFISYSRHDKPFMRRLYDSLDAYQKDTWVDWKDIPPTAEFLSEIYAAIEAADTFVFLISLDSVNSDICNLEVQHALKHQKRIVPILCRDVHPKTLPDGLPVKILMEKINWLNFCDPDEFESNILQLIHIINTDLDHVRAHTRLLTRAIEWQQNRDISFLLRGKDLDDAEEWLSNTPEKEPKPSSLQFQYISASRQDQTKQNERWKALYEEAEKQRIASEINTIQTLVQLARSLFFSHDYLASLLAIVRAGKRMKELGISSDADNHVIYNLGKIFYEIQELTRLEGDDRFVSCIDDLAPESQ